MAIHKTRHNPSRHNIALTLKGTIVLLGLVSVGYVVVVLAELSAPLPPIKTLDWQPGVATAGIPRAPAAATAAQSELTIFPMAT